MKKLIATTAIALAAFSAQAVISISWVGQFGFYANPERTGGTLDTNQGILSPSANPDGDVFIQLIYSTDNVADAALPGGLLDGPDQVLYQGPLASFGGSIGTPYGDNTVGFSLGAPLPDRSPLGFVYGRIFEGLTIGAGSHYYTGPVTALTSVNPGPPPGLPQTYQVNKGLGPFGGDVLDQTVVPEPTSLALLGIGAISAAWFRRRQKR